MYWTFDMNNDWTSNLNWVYFWSWSDCLWTRYIRLSVKHLRKHSSNNWMTNWVWKQWVKQRSWGNRVGYGLATEDLSINMFFNVVKKHTIKLKYLVTGFPYFKVVSDNWCECFEMCVKVLHFNKPPNPHHHAGSPLPGPKPQPKHKIPSTATAQGGIHNLY